MIPPRSSYGKGRAPAARSVRGRVSLEHLVMGAGQLRRRGWDPRRTAQIGSGRADASTQARRTPSASLGGLSGPNSNLAAPARRIKAAHETTTAANVSGPNRTRTQEPAPGGSAQQPLRVRDADVAEHASGSSAASSPNSSLSEAAGALETRTGRIHHRTPCPSPDDVQRRRRARLNTQRRNQAVIATVVVRSLRSASRSLGVCAVGR
jgi:hypothetical protein